MERGSIAEVCVVAARNTRRRRWGTPKYRASRTRQVTERRGPVAAPKFRHLRPFGRVRGSVGADEGPQHAAEGVGPVGQGAVDVLPHVDGRIELVDDLDDVRRQGAAVVVEPIAETREAEGLAGRAGEDEVIAAGASLHGAAAEVGSGHVAEVDRVRMAGRDDRTGDRRDFGRGDHLNGRLHTADGFGLRLDARAQRQGLELAAAGTLVGDGLEHRLEALVKALAVVLRAGNGIDRRHYGTLQVVEVPPFSAILRLASEARSRLVEKLNRLRRKRPATLPTRRHGDGAKPHGGRVNARREGRYERVDQPDSFPGRRRSADGEGVAG